MLFLANKNELLNQEASPSFEQEEKCFYTFYDKNYNLNDFLRLKPSYNIITGRAEDIYEFNFQKLNRNFNLSYYLVKSNPDYSMHIGINENNTAVIRVYHKGKIYYQINWSESETFSFFIRDKVKKFELTNIKHTIINLSPMVELLNKASISAGF